MAVTVPRLLGHSGPEQSFSAKTAAGKGIGPFTTRGLHGVAMPPQAFVAKDVPTDIYLSFPPFEFGFTGVISGSGFARVKRSRRLYRLLGGYRR